MPGRQRPCAPASSGGRFLSLARCRNRHSNRSDGRPQLSEVWFLADGDTVRLSLNSSRQKTKNLLRNPACNLFILDLANPYRYLELRGDAVIEADPDYSLAARVGSKYGAVLNSTEWQFMQVFVGGIPATAEVSTLV